MKRLRVLNVEDNPDDSLLIRRELHKAGYDLVFERVETAEQMGAALDRSEWDVVISDYSLPRFSVPEALTLIAERGLDLPFILISGVLTEEKAVSLVGARASDYLLKCNLARLGPAVRRILQESELKNESSLTKDALEQEIAAREEERRRIARELHDEAGQLLTSLLARARVIEEAASLQAAKTQAGALRELTAETMDSISRLALGLHPTVLDDLGLSAALEAYVDEYEKSHGIEVDADIEP
ncbi:MAG TPA: response regulator, partial [Terriglobales bacterium]|nr:response regulator [Terriglobales bacterium]